jgi:hypothetical protein
MRRGEKITTMKLQLVRYRNDFRKEIFDLVIYHIQGSMTSKVRALFWVAAENLALRNESTIDDFADNVEARRTGITLDETPSRRNSLVFTRRGPSSRFQKVASNAFHRRRDESPNSRRSRQTHMTLPYLTFTPTVRRNSVSPHYLFII